MFLTICRRIGTPVMGAPAREKASIGPTTDGTSADNSANGY